MISEFTQVGELNKHDNNLHENSYFDDFFLSEFRNEFVSPNASLCFVKLVFIYDNLLMASTKNSKKFPYYSSQVSTRSDHDFKIFPSTSIIQNLLTIGRKSQISIKRRCMYRQFYLYKYLLTISLLYYAKYYLNRKKNFENGFLLFRNVCNVISYIFVILSRKIEFSSTYIFIFENLHQFNSDESEKYKYKRIDFTAWNFSSWF